MLWGKGFEVNRAGSLPWLQDADVHFWGDLDTHGLAILNQLRAWLPRTRSFLMDRDTLLAHRERWGSEPAPATARLDRLSTEEAALYEDLVTDRFGRPGVRGRRPTGRPGCGMSSRVSSGCSRHGCARCVR